MLFVFNITLFSFVKCAILKSHGSQLNIVTTKYLLVCK